MSIHEHSDDLPMSTPQGATPNGTIAYSNKNCEAFAGVRNHDGKFFTGYQWQCVEFARRWLWDQKGLMLPDIDIAAEIFFVPHVYDPLTHTKVPVRPVRNGGKEKPTAGTYLIYAPAADNFPGHIAVITGVGADHVLVADQNRDFRKWPGDYAVKFPLVHDAKRGTWTIVDKEDPIIGWVQFPGRDDVHLEKPEADTWTDEKGIVHAKMRRPIPADFDVIPDYTTGERRKTFWSAMFSYRPHWVIMPFMLSRILFLYYVFFPIKYTLRAAGRRLLVAVGLRKAEDLGKKGDESTGPMTG
mmetsp:Transcript_16409/g.50910  ORF Transcript_16409/g.50910 Transcript_16409/m.50910 type:complete len:299 (+) Transcript_16409:44-940(+)